MFLNIIYRRLTVTHLKPSCGCITSDCIFENSLSTLFFKKKPIFESCSRSIFASTSVDVVRHHVVNTGKESKQTNAYEIF